jgi:hypothetical protein
MKVSEALNVIDAGWVRKAKGFRVQYDKWNGSAWVTEFSPDEDKTPLNSDVVAWRLAWKLAQATVPDTQEIEEGQLANLHVIDDLGHPIKYYATNRFERFNEREKV